MSVLRFDLYLATSGPYQFAFASDQIEGTAPCPEFKADGAVRPGVLGIHEGMPIVHPGWFWGDEVASQLPQHLLLVRSGICALAVDTCRLERAMVEPPPTALYGSGMVFGLVATPEGLVPVLDLTCIPLS